MLGESTILSRFQFPEACFVGQRIAKTLFGESEAFSWADRRLFAKDVEEARCAYLLDAEKTHLAAEVDDERDFSCLAVIDIVLRSQLHAKRIAELCHRAMPYPLLVVLHGASGEIAFSLAEKRMSRDGRETTVLESRVETDCHAEDSLTPFFASMSFGKFVGRTFRELYRWLWARMEALNAAQVTGVFSVDEGDPEKRRAALAAIHRLDGEIADMRRQAKAKLPLNDLVELNVSVKRLLRERDQWKGALT